MVFSLICMVDARPPSYPLPFSFLYLQHTSNADFENHTQSFSFPLDLNFVGRRSAGFAYLPRSSDDEGFAFFSEQLLQEEFPFLSFKIVNGNLL